MNTNLETLPGRIFWNWELTHECNYRCSYCPTWNDGVKTPQILSTAQWKRIWDRIFDLYYSCIIRFTGGEPSTYPDFSNIVGAVSQKHTIDITTNLSFDVDDFMRSIEPGNVAISASFHPEFNEVTAFLEKVVRLHKNGFMATICVVAYPPHLRDLAYYKKVTEDAGIMFKFLPFTGEYRGLRYPESFTAEEKNLTRELAETTRDDTGKQLNKQWNEWNTEKRSSDEGIRKEKLCSMGHTYAIINTFGEVKRCCAPDGRSLGSIFDSAFHLLSEPQPCESSRCPCFKAMIVGEEDRWRGLWDGLKHKKYGRERDKQILGKCSHE